MARAPAKTKQSGKAQRKAANFFVPAVGGVAAVSRSLAKLIRQAKKKEERHKPQQITRTVAATETGRDSGIRAIRRHPRKGSRERQLLNQ